MMKVSVAGPLSRQGLRPFGKPAHLFSCWVLCLCYKRIPFSCLSIQYMAAVSGQLAYGLTYRSTGKWILQLCLKEPEPPANTSEAQ